MDSFFAIILASISIGTPFINQYIIRWAINKDYASIAFGVGIIVSMLIVRMMSNFVVTKWGHFMGIKMEAKMRNDAIAKLHRLPMKNFDQTDTGAYISRVVTDLKDIPEFAHHGPEDFIIALLTAAGGFTYAFLQSWLIGTVLLVVFIVGAIVIYFIRSKWRAIWKKVREANSDMSASIGFQVEGISEIKSYSSEDFEKVRFNAFQDKYKKHFFRMYSFEGYFTISNIFIMSLTSLITLSIGAYFVADEKIAIDQLMGLTAAAVILNQPMQKFVNVYTMISRGSSSVDRFFEFMDQPEEKGSGTIIPEKLNGVIEFKNVNFSYFDKDGVKIDVLKNFNLKINKGEKVALVGETGIGKSTILKLLLKYYDIQSGQILIDNVDIAKYDTHYLRKKLGYIQQQSTLFHDTIKNNILYGNAQASQEQIIEAAKDAYIYDFINHLPHKFDTIAGPRGAKLSGGQRQRVSIARAFISDPDVLLMDEATSSLDNATELKIKVATQKLTHNKTTLIVAHRLSTIRDVDRVIVIGRGGIILEQGVHAELLALKGYYFNMYNAM